MFFFVVKYIRGVNSAEKKAGQMASVAVENLYTNKKRPRQSGFLVLKHNPYVDVDVKISVQK